MRSSGVDVDPALGRARDGGHGRAATSARSSRRSTELGLKLQVILNKGSVMVLPSGVDKATGLAAALGELGISPRETIGVGDAENDPAFLEHLRSVGRGRQRPAGDSPTCAHVVTEGADGRGVAELIEQPA